MLGYYRPQEQPVPEKVNNKRLKLLIQNLENIVELLKEEVCVEEEETNIVRFEDMIQKIQDEYEDPEYQEED
jgi:hypothetical protein